jgi:phosphoribosylamine--glycine ligase
MNKPQNVLVIGTGGREHALAWKISRSPNIGKIYIAPGNAGTAEIAENIAIGAGDVPALLEFARTHDIALTVVGPDDTLAAGIVDEFAAAGRRIFGPTKAAAQIEASKAFSKELMSKSNIPTARFATFTELEPALAYVLDHRFPVVVKASGLALGKGVVKCRDLAEAQAALRDMMENKVFGAAGNSVVVEDYLTGQEVSIHAFCDGHTAALFPTAQDHKPAHDGDQGPNTGGMGTYAPVPWAGTKLVGRAKTTVVEPILAAMREAGAPFTGLLYPGLMISDDDINVLEFNARFGDPETQSYMRLLETDLLEILNACVDGRLADIPIKWSSQTAVTVVLASGGYPGKYKKGLPITGVDEASALPGVVVFHAGTTIKDGQLLTAGGRVLGVSATGADLKDAQAKAYSAAKLIQFDGVQYRTDIGSKAL